MHVPLLPAGVASPHLALGATSGACRERKHLYFATGIPAPLAFLHHHHTPAAASFVTIALFTLAWGWVARRALRDHNNLPFSRYKCGRCSCAGCCCDLPRFDVPAVACCDVLRDHNRPPCQKTCRRCGTLWSGAARPSSLSGRRRGVPCTCARPVRLPVHSHATAPHSAANVSQPSGPIPSSPSNPARLSFPLSGPLTSLCVCKYACWVPCRHVGRVLAYGACWLIWRAVGGGGRPAAAEAGLLHSSLPICMWPCHLSW